MAKRKPHAIIIGGALGIPSHDRLYLDHDDNIIAREYSSQTHTSWNRLYGHGFGWRSIPCRSAPVVVSADGLTADLKHAFNESDEGVCHRWGETPGVAIFFWPTLL